MKFKVLKRWIIVVTKNKVFWDLILCVVEIMAGVSKDSPYISTELNVSEEYIVYSPP